MIVAGSFDNRRLAAVTGGRMNGRQKLIDRVSAQGDLRVTRRQVLQGARAVVLTAVSRPAAAFAHDDDEPLGPFGPWSEPVNLGPVVNSPYNDNSPAISKDGLSLYITSSPLQI